MPSHSHRENPTLAYDRDLQLIEYAEFLGFRRVLGGGTPQRGLGDDTGA